MVDGVPDACIIGRTANGSGPSVSVIIPCRNEADRIGACLKSILASDLGPVTMAVVVVDGMSTDSTRAIVEGMASRDSRLGMIDNPRKTKPAALNLGIALTDSDVVMRIDAHAVYPSDYVRELVMALFTYGVDNVGGVRDTYAGGTPQAAAAALVLSHPFAAGNAYWRTGVRKATEVDTVFCGCYRRQVFAKIGGFNEALLRTQDREFNARLRSIGGRILLLPNVRCVYFPRTSIVEYARWTADGAYWLFCAKLFTSVPMLSWRNWIPIGFVAWHAVIVTAVLFCGAEVALLAATPVALYWSVAATIGVRFGFARKDPIAGVLGFLYLGVTHFAYAAGSIGGLITRYTRQRIGSRS